MAAKASRGMEARAQWVSAVRADAEAAVDMQNSSHCEAGALAAARQVAAGSHDAALCCVDAAAINGLLHYFQYLRQRGSPAYSAMACSRRARQHKPGGLVIAPHAGSWSRRRHGRPASCAADR